MALDNIYFLIVGAFLLYHAYHLVRWLTCVPDFKSKVVLITGGSSGIGEGLAKRFIEIGASKVIIAARTLNELNRVKSECKYPDRVEVCQIDLSKPEACEKISKEHLASKNIDILINNGGLSMREEFVNTNIDTCKYIMDTNCMSHIALIKGIIPEMIA